MAKTIYSFPVESIKGTLSSERNGDTIIVHRRKCFGKAKNGTPLYGPCETYTYHPPKNQWSRKISDHRELFKQAQKHDKPNPNEKRYIKLQCYIAAQLLKTMKVG